MRGDTVRRIWTISQPTIDHTELGWFAREETHHCQGSHDQCGDEQGRSHVTYWTHQYGDARVFGTTIGHANRVVADPVFLNTLARGLLWATGTLDGEGNPWPAYNRNLGTR